jgi:hypothetical protein
MVVAGKGPTENVAAVEPGHRDMDLHYEWTTSDDKYGDHSTLKNFLLDEKEKAANAFHTSEITPPDVALTNAQKTVIYHLTNF